MISTEIANASKIMIGSTLASAMYIGSEKLWPVELHEYVEIGGLRWATMNIGANRITDIGLFYPWGETQGYSSYGSTGLSWRNYKYGNGTASPGESGMTKYNSTDGRIILDLEDDAASVNWGGNWRTPSVGEWKSLINNTNLQYTTNYLGSGVNGWLCTDKTDSNKKLFFPVNVKNTINGTTYILGLYCSNLLYIEDKTKAYRTAFRNYGVFAHEKNLRYIGQGVRAVMDIPHYYSLNYFTIESLEDNNSVSIERTNTSPGNKNMSYSLDEGVTWTDLTLTNNTSIATINTGDKILFKGINSTMCSSWDKHWHFRGGKTFKTYGNAMSLLFGDDFLNNSEFTSGTTHNLCGIFNYTSTLVDASNLILPALTCTISCYNGTFRGCTNLTTAPVLPATKSAQDCYSSMFEECINLEEAPEINLTDLSQACCQRMFCMDRNSKITTPKMTKSPILRVATGASNCYKEMFKGNDNLVEVTCLLELNKDCLNWLLNCSDTGTLKKSPNTTWANNAYVPSGWTVIDYVES